MFRHVYSGLSTINWYDQSRWSYSQILKGLLRLALGCFLPQHDICNFEIYYHTSCYTLSTQWYHYYNHSQCCMKLCNIALSSSVWSNKYYLSPLGQEQIPNGFMCYFHLSKTNYGILGQNLWFNKSRPIPSEMLSTCFISIKKCTPPMITVFSKVPYTMILPSPWTSNMGWFLYHKKCDFRHPAYFYTLSEDYVFISHFKQGSLINRYFQVHLNYKKNDSDHRIR